VRRWAHAVSAAALAAGAQQTATLPTVGFLVGGTPSSHGHWFVSFERTKDPLAEGARHY